MILLDVLLQTSPMWDKFEEDEIKRISSITPRNAFEEMIQWTHEGILWKFPIDNEQGSFRSKRTESLIYFFNRYWTRSRRALLRTCSFGKASARVSKYAVDSTVHGDGLRWSWEKSLLDCGTESRSYQLVSNILQRENARLQRNRPHGNDQSDSSSGDETRFDLQGEASSTAPSAQGSPCGRSTRCQGTSGW